MIGFGSRSLPRLTFSGIAGVAGCGVADAGEGPADSGGGMGGNWGGEDGGGVVGGRMRIGRVCLRDHGNYGPECSGFFERPKIAAVFAGSLGTEDCRFPENIPILSSLTNMPPILPVEDS